MTTYRVTAFSLNIHSGILGLNASQADARIHRLTALGGNRYEVTRPPVQFKRGEIIEIEGQLPKGMVQDVEEAEGFSKVEAWVAPKEVEHGKSEQPKKPNK